LKTPDQELVSNALSQRRLRTNNGEVNLMVSGGPDQPIYIGGTYIYVLGELSRAGIARSDIDFLYFWALGQLPDQGMLPPPSPNNQYLYLTYPLRCLL